MGPGAVTTLIWHGRTYQVENRGELGLYVGAPAGGAVICTDSKASSEAVAVRWLACMSLRKGKARELVAEEMKHEPKDESRLVCS